VKVGCRPFVKDIKAEKYEKKAAHIDSNCRITPRNKEMNVSHT
jgi:hypothetical protein